MNYEEAMAYINGIEVFGSKLGLSNITRLMELLGRPQDSLKTIHVAGTNGKGSVSAFIASILTHAGYKTGLFTSPHIDRFSERIVIDGEEISEAEIASSCVTVKSKADFMVAKGCAQPTHFEIVTAIALLHFARKRCDFTVLEVGLGGRLDATNVIGVPECAVITAIAHDHTNVLGGTLSEIAFEKAGIIKPGGDVVTYSQQAEAMQTLENVCDARGARLHVSSRLSDFEIPLLGEHQRKNAALAVKAAEILREKGWKIPDSAICDGLRNTKWPARFEVLSQNPPIIADGAHNPHGVRALVASLKSYFPDKTALFVMGVLADKDYGGMIDAALPLASRFLTVSPDSPRALPAPVLAEQIIKKNAPAESFNTVAEALNAALSRAGANDVICIFGSLYFIGEARTLIMNRGNQRA